MNKPARVCLSVLVVLFLTACGTTPPTDTKAPRNVVFVIADGMGFAHVKAYRMYADDPTTRIIEPLPMDDLLVGAVATDSIRLNCEEPGISCEPDPYGFTDSASSATAYATGRDTITGQLGVDTAGKPMATILEDARKRGKSTGLVATSQITHASPAAFGSHVTKRKEYNRIADQYFDNSWQGQPMIEVMLGGGLKYMQRDDRDLVSEFQQAGYEVALNRSEMLNMKGGKLLGLFAPSGLPPARDRGNEIPSLSEMAQTALQALNKNDNGFFLMLEGSQVDWAAHDNNVAGVISEMEDFVAAVDVLLEFARQDRDTLVVIVADHETGGMSVGRDGVYRWDPVPLRGLTATPEAMVDRYVSGNDLLSDIVARNVAFDLEEAEISALDATPRDEEPAMEAITNLFNNRTFTGWSSGGHTGIDVPLYAFGPGSEQFHAVMQNEEVGQTLYEVFLQ